MGDRIGSIRFFKPNYDPTRNAATQPDVQNWDAKAKSTLYLTNARILLKNDAEERSILLGQITDLRPYERGTEIFLNDGDSVYIEFDTGVDVFIVLLGRAIRDIS